MKSYWAEFKDGSISAVGVVGATTLTICGLVIVMVLLGLYYGWHWFGVLARIVTPKEVPSFEMSTSAICDTYLYWYEKITTAIKNLVK